MLQKAIADFGKPEIVNSDQGSQFTCECWTEYLKNQEITISIDGKGDAWIIFGLKDFGEQLNKSIFI